MSKSDAQSTVEFAIMSGLSNRAHLTGITIDRAQIVIDDIMAELFSPHLIWALQEHAQHCLHTDPPSALAGGVDSKNTAGG